METFGLVIIILFGISLFYFFRDRDKMLSSKVDSYGGMRVKYKTIIEALLKDPQARVTKEERDMIIISLKSPNTMTSFVIIQNFYDVEIVWNADLAHLGKYHHKWVYNAATNQDLILKDIRNHIFQIAAKVM
jgi:hypothetical protein